MKLSTRVLNRTTLDRQFLLERQGSSLTGMIHDLVGLQAQATTPPYLALWSRFPGFTPDALSELITRREVVRMTLMRGTLHLVTAEDAFLLRPVLQPMLSQRIPAAGVDHDELAAMGRKILDEQPCTVAELDAALQERWPSHGARALAVSVQLVLPLVQVPPRGLWGVPGTLTNAVAATWLGREFDAPPDVGAVITRYLRAFGPASVADVAAWSKLTGLRPHMQKLDLRSYSDENGRELFDVPEGVLADPDVPAPPRFLPSFDNVLLSHADRTRVMSEEHRKIWGNVKNGVFPATFMVDGFVRGTWTLEEKRQSTTLVLTPYAKVSKKDLAALSREGRRLLALLAPGKTHEIRA